MIDTLLQRLHMTIKHGRRAAPAHPVPDAMDLKPLLRAFFPAANFIAHLRIEDLGTAASE